eukprot:TRINITY_DN177_c0_g1_i8.p1 TRINITY_DN177_c0_g1~~TRINITY_DN177_c0_g1_i8.p1  ORF type:complete len:1126 (+),score=205.84 TRINITY_DN177_c0_g1_i8:74-3379(+)
MAEQPEDDRASFEADDAALGSAGEEDVEMLEEEAEGEEETGEVLEEQGEEGGGGESGEINISSFEDIVCDSALVNDLQESWRHFVNAAASKEAAADTIYGAFYEASPSTQYLFTSPRAIAAMKFFGGIQTFAAALSDPPVLKNKVENLSFGHLALDITIPRVVLIRDALLDLLTVELGSKLTSNAVNGWRALMNYVGGAIIYIKKFYNGRILLINESWGLANKSSDADADVNASSGGPEAAKEGKKEEGSHTENSGGKGKTESLMQNVPTTFKEMFQFNAAVMGFGANLWMNEVLACFENLVLNVASPNRLNEECDFIVCRIARVSSGKINLAEFKSGMLASLRSLLPKDWTTQHEVAWSWMWELVERLVVENLGSPPKWEKAYAKFLDGIDEATGFQLRRDIYLKFFAAVPAGQDVFKQSNAYLHLVSTKVLNMALNIFKDPVKMVDDISAVGLRHVGYGVVPELVPPFASSTVEVVNGYTQDPVCLEGFGWSMGLMAKCIARTINEGSTIVMKAIIANSKKGVQKALSSAPRGVRSKWQLLIQVGSQNISPLAWAIESGSLEASSAMLNDLLTFRADRDRYYYSADELFVRHPTVVAMILSDAPSLLPELLDCLIWRSRVTSNGLRRVNFYVKHLLVDPEGKFAKTLEWVIKAKDPKIVCHPVLVWLSDDVWSRVAAWSFLVRKSWFVFILLLFIVTQSVLSREEKDYPMRCVVMALRLFIYVFSLGGELLSNLRLFWKSFRTSDYMKIGCVKIPRFLENWQAISNLFLLALLIAMLATEPILYCMADGSTDFTDDCTVSRKQVLALNSEFAMGALFVYCILLVDLAVLNNRVSAYVLVVLRMLSEVGLFLFALVGMLLTFSSGLACMIQPVPEFRGIPQGVLAFWEMFMGILNSEGYAQMRHEPLVLVGAYAFMVTSYIFLLNLLIAQLTCAYGTIYADMVGYARIKRIRTIVETMPQITAKRWQNFVAALSFETKIEFNEGDVGIKNGVATVEPANAHPTTVDVIKRFGGSTSPDIQWPEEVGTGSDDAEKFERLETVIKRSMERIAKAGSTKKGGGGSKLDNSSGGGGGGSKEGSVAGGGSVAGSEEHVADNGGES